MRLRSAFLITGACLTIAAAAAAPVAGAAAPPVLGPADGVQATLTGQTLVVRFTGPSATAPQIAGKQLDVACAAHPAPPGLQFVGDKPGAHGSETVTAEGVLQVKLDRATPIDACDIEGTEDGVVPTVARVALDPVGVLWVDESMRAPALADLLGRARSATAYRPAAAMVGGTVVAMDGPSATPPLGQIGYWTDPAGTMATAVTVSAAGRRLVVQDLGGGMLRTNVIAESGVLDHLLESVLHGTGDGAPGLPGANDADRPRGSSPFGGTPSPYRGEPVGPHDGVRARFAGRRLTINFTGRSAKAFRTVAGRRVAISCLDRPVPGLFGGAVTPPNTFDTVVRVPAHGGTLTATLRGRGDACTVRDDTIAVAFAATTAAGHGWLADVDALGELDHLPGSLAAAGGTTYLPAATVAAKHPNMVALASPGAAVPRGHVGTWTDNAHQALVAVDSADGHRFVLSDEGDGMLRTNAYTQFSGLFFFLTD
ncbi:MAG TPA: hypothetical protein VGM33_20460 [Baekduia sp.]|jgi:hypothetical protein